MKTALLWTLALFMLAAPGAAEAITASITVTRAGAATVTVPRSSLHGPAGRPACSLACTNSTAGARTAPPPTPPARETIKINNGQW